MRAAVLAAVMILALVVHASSVQAQDGLRSASLPERPIATPPPGPDDLFRATPQTYGPNPTPQPPPYFFPGGIVYGGWPWSYDDARRWRRQHPEAERFRRDGDTRRDELERPATLPPPPAPPAPPTRAALPKTFYVIPGCYAGDKPPSRTTLARGCDRSKLRVIPPVVSDYRLPATGHRKPEA